VDQFSKPRYILGIGQEHIDRGLCYSSIYLPKINEESYTQQTIELEEILTDEYTSPLYFNYAKLNKLSENIGIYENPILDNTIKYADHISWGCVDKLNILGLENYCRNQLWKHKSFFNILNDLSYISKFGNPDRHLILDWIMAEPFVLESYRSNWDNVNNKCTVPSVLNVDILYGTFGLVNNTQHAVVNVRFRLDYTYWWSKNPYDSNIEDNFYSHLNLNFFKIPQDKVWWYAPAPGFIKLNKNILYPFRFGTTQYGTTTSSANYINSIDYIFLINLLLLIINII